MPGPVPLMYLNEGDRVGVRQGRENGWDIIEIRQGSWFEPLKDVEGKLSGLVSNPPYIPSDHISGLQPEVGWHEPRLALDGGVDGIDALLHLCNGAASMLKPGGFFIFEHIRLACSVSTSGPPLFCSSGAFRLLSICLINIDNLL
ncbi:Release factor glutamine methyltransferase [Vitis vinifera]|uniref:Release factor glutamine methyltransferase n=1 Tax=Vitis vinifera TaxID=29760 RepID=A0A438H212_VITVI|nr:Release factor glutamine methyltransferase [Vitis vinifera]